MASRWVEPRTAVERYGDGLILLAPPTFYTLADLARWGSATAAIDAAARRKVTAVQPRFAEVADDVWPKKADTQLGKTKSKVNLIIIDTEIIFFQPQDKGAWFPSLR